MIAHAGPTRGGSGRWLIGALVSISLFGACAHRDADVPLIQRELIEGVSTVSVFPRALAAAPTWPVDSQPLFDIATAASLDEGLHRVSGVQLLSDSIIVVGDQGSGRLLFYGVDGGFRYSRGRPGRGPGEFTELNMVASDDHHVITTYDVASGQATIRDHYGDIAGTERIGAVVQVFHRSADGTYVARTWSGLPKPSQDGVVNEHAKVVRLSQNGTVAANYGTFVAERYVLRRGPRGPTGGPPPFRQQFLVAARDSTVAVTSGERYEIGLYSRNGSQIARIRIVREPRKVGRQHVAAFRDSVLSRYAKDEYTTREWTMLSADDVFPSAFPEISAMHFDRAGLLWVRDFSLPGDSVATWTILSAEGHPRGRLRLPLGFAPYDILADRLLGVQPDSEGGEHVVGYRYRPEHSITRR